MNMYVEYAIDIKRFNTMSYRQKRKIKHEKLEALKSLINNGSVKSSKSYHLVIPTKESHENHDPEHKGNLFVQPLHKKVIEKIYELVSEGIIDSRIIKLQISDYVKNVLQKGTNSTIDPSDSSYYPDLGTISNHIQLALRAYRYNKL